MTRPIVDDSSDPEVKIGRVRQRVTRLERRPQPPTTAAGTLNAIRCWTTNMALVFPTSTDLRLSYDHVSSFDSTVFATIADGVPRTYRVKYLKKGWYSAFLQFVWTTTFTAGNIGVMFQYVGDTLGASTAIYPADTSGFSFQGYAGYSVTRYFPDEFDYLPGITEPRVFQSSGVNRTINQSNWHHVYHGDSDF